MNPEKLRQLLSGIAPLALLVPPIGAHDALAEYIWHRVEITAETRHVDVTVKLTFFEDWSERERRRMDADGDGRIGRSEIERYGADIAGALKPRLTLLIAGRPVPLVPLYAPEVDLQGRGTVGRAHHQLTLHYFAPLPPGIVSGAALVVEDRMWSEAPSFGEIETSTAATGGQFETAAVTERKPDNQALDTPLRFSARYVSPAATQTPGH